MLNNVEIIVMVPIFIILLVVVFKPTKTIFNLDTFPSCVLSVCVSALCVIGMNLFLKDSIEVILLPYAALGITLLWLLFISFIWKCFEKSKRYLNKRKERFHGQLDKKREIKINDNNIRKQPYKRKGYLQ